VAFTSRAGNQNQIEKRLRIQWWTALVLCLSILLGSFLMFAWRNHGLNNAQWILQALTVTMFVLGLLRYGLKWNYRPDHSNLMSTLGYGTWLTIIRGALIAVLAGYLFQPWLVSKFSPGAYSWTPGLLYIAAAVLDFFDGRVARASQHETRLGAFLDINFDALGLLIASLVAVWYGQLPVAYLSVGCAYYIYRTGIWLRKTLSKPVTEPGPWRGARIIAGVQMGFVGIALLPILRPPATTLTAYIVMIPLLIGFVRDWMIVCGYRISK
jgi:CDP-diacylglycerol--glycerol-3-phosphate 3-phosphatidyltransferase